MVASNLFYRLFAGAVVVIVIISVVIGIFVQPLFEIGRNRFYMESRVTGQSAGIGKLFWGFSNGYLKLVGTQFLRGLITESVVILASLLGFLVILFNGVEWIGSVFWAVMICATIGAFVSVYFQYCYLMVPYILAENPDMKTMEVLRLSKEMMDGQKWNAFVLGLSFLGWQLLGTLLCGIGTFFVQPYVDATFAELYAVLRGPYSGRLNGFGGEPFVQNNARYGGHTFLCVRLQQIHSEILHDLSNWTDQFFYNLQNLPSASFSVHNGRFSLFSIFYSSLVRRTFVSMKRL